MINARRIITITGTLFCALATGFLMQHVLQRSNPDDGVAKTVQVASTAGMQEILSLAEETTELVAQSSVGAPAKNADLPVPPTAMPHPAHLSSDPVRIAARDDLPIDTPSVEETAPSFVCDVIVRAVPGAAAMVKVVISAPCLTNERYSLHHNGLKVSDVTDAKGSAAINVPALSENAVYIVTFDVGQSAVATAKVESIEYYDRAVVQWSGLGGWQMHALEYGATYGEAGHVWNGAAREMAVAARGEGGFVMRIGGNDALNPHFAEVYTFPSATALRGGSVAMSVEAEVTNENCGRDLEAQLLQKSGLNPMKVHDLTLAMPDCSAVGEFLVLKNLMDDLNIAQSE